MKATGEAASLVGRSSEVTVEVMEETQKYFTDKNPFDDHEGLAAYLSRNKSRCISETAPPLPEV